MKQKESQEKLLDQLNALKVFPKNKLASQLRKQIQDKLKKLEIKKPREPSKEEKKRLSNLSRSGKMRRYHNYIRQIRNNFPNYSYKQIRSQLSRRKKQQSVPIPDVIWQNPSP
jgi:phage I-like protein